MDGASERLPLKEVPMRIYSLKEQKKNHAMQRNGGIIFERQIRHYRIKQTLTIHGAFGGHGPGIRCSFTCSRRLIHVSTYVLARERQ